ncbi:MAG: nucleotidyltransferase substrate binding protein [Rhodospirillales bacterium]|nr:nucleotidyltransferase substrate binding protein [Rhodospirillales bacterium]
MRLDLSTFERAIAQLGQGLTTAEAHPGDDLMRDGVNQRFEYTYELSHKMLRRHLTATEPNPEAIDALSFPNLIRLGSERGLLLHGWDRWKTYRAARGTTSHTYDAEKARQVFAQVPDFLAEARHLLDRLQQRVDQG